MLESSDGQLRLLDLRPGHDGDLSQEVIAGLGAPQKKLPPKLLYDERGSTLFDRICLLEEYYPTRTELGILRRSGEEIASLLGDECLLVELGAGNAVKGRLLLDRLARPAGYVPVDIAGQALIRSARRISIDYPGLEVLPVCADFTKEFPLPSPRREPRRTVFFFPGSTIGNLEPEEAELFLRGLAEKAGAGGGVLVGVDLKKDPRVLHAAYNDAAGVTAAFNANLLERLNRELAGEFHLEQFAHYAIYNPGAGRVEMHLVSLEDQVIGVAGEWFEFRQGESIHTENSYKYTLEQFQELAARAGLRHERSWLDERRLFSLQYLEVR